MKHPLQVYKIGLTAIGIFVLSLVWYVLAQAGATKQDTQTYNAANGIVQKLNDYIDSEAKLPDSLRTIGITNAPTAVAYQKLSDQSFKFCVTYKTNSGGISSSSVPDVLLSIEGPAASDAYSSPNMLVLSPLHHKGTNCQTITPPFLGSNDNSFNSYNFGTPPTQTQ